jgi:hypothetical protein
LTVLSCMLLIVFKTGFFSSKDIRCFWHSWEMLEASLLHFPCGGKDLCVPNWPWQGDRCPYCAVSSYGYFKFQCSSVSLLHHSALQWSPSMTLVE